MVPYDLTQGHLKCGGTRDRYLPGPHRRALRNADAIIRGFDDYRGCVGCSAFHPEPEPRIREKPARNDDDRQRGERSMTQRNEPHDDISRYEFSGIEKRHGIVPAWLAVVFFGKRQCEIHRSNSHGNPVQGDLELATVRSPATCSVGFSATAAGGTVVHCPATRPWNGR